MRRRVFLHALGSATMALFVVDNAKLANGRPFFTAVPGGTPDGFRLERRMAGLADLTE